MTIAGFRTVNLYRQITAESWLLAAADGGDLLDNVSKPIVLFLHSSTLMKCGSHSTEPLREILDRA